MSFRLYKKREIKKYEWVLLLLLILSALVLKMISMPWRKVNVFLGEQTFRVLVADTPQRRFEGWSDKKDMGKYGGMLFVYPDSGQHSMMMRDMNFPLDMVWLNGNEIVDMAPNVQPQPNAAESELIPYFSRLPSDMVLELPAGFIKENRLKIGDKMEVLE